jgi:hypothetical protein
MISSIRLPISQHCKLLSQLSQLVLQGSVVPDNVIELVAFHF